LIPSDEVLVTRLLADAGYTCGLSGKLHISTCHPSACPATERRINDGYAEFHWSHHPSPDWPTNEYTGWLSEKGEKFRQSEFRKSKYVQIGMPAELHQTTWCAQKAINFIETSRTFNRPWLFSVNMFDPHHPFDPPLDYLRRYLVRLDEIPLPNYVEGELENKPLFQRADHQGAYNNLAGYCFPEMSDEDHRLIRAAYWATVDLIDEQIGRILEALEATHQLEKTIIIFTSDHGEMLGDHGIYLKGPYFYEPAIRVPFIIHWPKVIKGNRRYKGIVELVDVAPTLLDAVGLRPHLGMQGKSMWSMLTGETQLEHFREDVYSEYYNAMPFHKHPAAYGTMVRTDHYKLAVMHGLEVGELYDLKRNPNETHNRWNDPAYVPVKLEMLERLCNRMAWTVDPLPLRQGPW
jgi:arylsulfatase A-like enzyme